MLADGKDWKWNEFHDSQKAFKSLFELFLEWDLGFLCYQASGRTTLDRYKKIILKILETTTCVFRVYFIAATEFF